MTISGDAFVRRNTRFSSSDIAELSMARVFFGWRNAVNITLVVLWGLGVGYFWVWWLDIEHVQSAGKYLVVTSILVWSTTLIPAYAILIISRARIPSGDAAAWKNRRVAMVVTKALSEPFPVLERTLRGALLQDGIPHDVWLADEDPTPQTIEWCRRHGVKISTRKGVTEYHREGWPRRTKSKEGNLAYFYDHYGYDRYDFVAQFDVDHVPSRHYLREALAPFADPRVGYVSAPSICDSNAATRWSARGRLHEEASMHGLLQAGYNSGWAPLCIGSHYTVRTAALRAIGGLGPELAEDHSTTLLLNSAGWRGVHAVDAIAHGNGPDSFVDLVVQEFQWSRSLGMILIKYSPTYVPRLSARLRFQFLFSQLWYPMFAGMMAAAVALPIYALLTGEHFVSVLYADFFVHILPLSIMLLVLAYWWRATGLFRPADAKIISWEGAAFRFLRWPWALFGSLAAAFDRARVVRSWYRRVLSRRHRGDRRVGPAHGENSVAPEHDRRRTLRRKGTPRIHNFRVTPKGAVRARHVPFWYLAPYVLLSLVSSLTVWLVSEPGTAAGFYVFCLITALIYGGLVVLVVVRHARENGLRIFPGTASGIATAVSIAAMAGGIAAAAHENGTRGLAAINLGITALTLTDTVYPPSGAGRGSQPIVRLRPQWHGVRWGAAQPPSASRKVSLEPYRQAAWS